MVGFYTLEGMLEAVQADIAGLPQAMLLLQASMLGILEPVVDTVAALVSEIAAELTAAHDFDILSFPELITFPSDNLVFALAGHTVVNFVGMERSENVPPEIVAQLTRFGEGVGDFTVTILHTPLDEFHTIEYLWPGMMAANMEAYITFLQAILTGRFS